MPSDDGGKSSAFFMADVDELDSAVAVQPVDHRNFVRHRHRMTLSHAGIPLSLRIPHIVSQVKRFPHLADCF